MRSLAILAFIVPGVFAALREPFPFLLQRSPLSPVRQQPPPLDGKLLARNPSERRRLRVRPPQLLRGTAFALMERGKGGPGTMDESAGEPDEISRSEPQTKPQDGILSAGKATGPLEIVAHVARRTFTTLDRKPGVSPSQVTIWTVEYISSHFSEKIPLAALARGAQLSKYHFLRKFRQEAGMTPGAYLKRYRIVQAMDYLTGTRHTVKKIGRMVGYRDPTAFSRAFTQITGTQPYLYRVTRRLKVAEQPAPALLPRAGFTRQEPREAQQNQRSMGT